MTTDELARLHSAGFTRSRPWTAQEFDDLLASPRTFLVTQPQAFALGRAIAGEAELLTLVTHPDHRRKGQAAACLAAFEGAARARHATSLFLEVASDNTAALALYETAGYQEAGRRPSYYPGLVDALLLQKRLPR